MSFEMQLNKLIIIVGLSTMANCECQNSPIRGINVMHGVRSPALYWV